MELHKNIQKLYDIRTYYEKTQQELQKLTENKQKAKNKHQRLEATLEELRTESLSQMDRLRRYFSSTAKVPDVDKDKIKQAKAEVSASEKKLDNIGTELSEKRKELTSIVSSYKSNVIIYPHDVYRFEEVFKVVVKDLDIEWHNKGFIYLLYNDILRVREDYDAKSYLDNEVIALVNAQPILSTHLSTGHSSYHDLLFGYYGLPVVLDKEETQRRYSK